MSDLGDPHGRADLQAGAAEVETEEVTTPRRGPASSLPRWSPPRGRLLLAVGLTVAYGVGQAVHAGPDQASAAAETRPALAAPAVTVQGLRTDGRLPWGIPLRLTARDGGVMAVTGTGPEGVRLEGAAAADGSWTAASGLAPSWTYRLTADVTDRAGAHHVVAVQARTTAPARTLHASISPGDSAVVGTGQAVQVRLSRPVTDLAARGRVEQRLQVTTVPAVPGAWRWTGPTEVRYRGAEPWPAGTRIRVTVPLDHVQAGPGVWGAGTTTSAFTVGDAVTSVVDTEAHTMTVSRNGAVLRFMKISTGRPGLETRNGTFVVLGKEAEHVMDSATVGLPPGTPAYRETVQDAVRLTNSGTFTHSAPWSVAQQGVANVSHGCVNLAPADAHWFYELARRGDLVTVVGSSRGPDLADAGSQDWNMTYDRWRSGSALPQR